MRCISETKTRQELNVPPFIGGIGPRLEKVSIEILPAPLAEQERFTARVTRYERLRAQMSEAERQVEGLFESLLAEAFQ